jgi:hypothetical protein
MPRNAKELFLCKGLRVHYSDQKIEVCVRKGGGQYLRSAVIGRTEAGKPVSPTTKDGLQDVRRMRERGS